MKKNALLSLFMMAMLAGAATMFTSCWDRDEILMVTSISLNPAISVDKSALAFNSSDETHEIIVTTDSIWECEVDADWAHATPYYKGNRIKVNVDSNNEKETRECNLTVYLKHHPTQTLSIKITQDTSLEIISCSETELNFSYYEGATNSARISSNGSWSVLSTPEWISPSVSKGEGDKYISFKTLSANYSSSSRTGTIVIGTRDDKVSIQVMQVGSARKNCQVTPKNITVLSNGIAFDMDYSQAGNVAHYYRGYIEASRTGIMTNPEIISKLKREFQRHLPSDDEVADFSELRPNTEYAIYTLAYDIEGKSGELMKTIVKTRPIVENEPCAWISDMTYDSNYWEWFVTKSATCYTYWQMATEDPDLAYASDVLQAWWLEDAVRQNKVCEYFNGGAWQMSRTGNMVAVWTLGKNADGTLAGKISWRSLSNSSSAETRGTTPTQTQTKRNVAGDHSGKKLRDGQYQLFMVK